MKTLSFGISNLEVSQELDPTDTVCLSRQWTESISQWKLRVDGLKASHLMQISRISHALLSNLPLSGAVDRNENHGVNAFLHTPDADALKSILAVNASAGPDPEEGTSGNKNRVEIDYAFIQLRAANDQIMKAKTALEASWQVRHEGLMEKLAEIRRAYVHWSLRVANMLFGNSLPAKIVWDRFEDTPLNEFKSSGLFHRFAPLVPALSEAVALAGVQDRKLFDAADELNRLVMFSEWDKAYLLYRDVFPAATNALVVRLDRVISQEKQIAEAQATCIKLFTEKIAPASETIMVSLDLLTRMLEGLSIIHQNLTHH